MRLNPIETKVLAALVSGFDPESSFYSFAVIMETSGIGDRKAVRRACRSLARKGLAQYGSGLWTEDGAMAGSGYAATKAGLLVSPTPEQGGG